MSNQLADVFNSDAFSLMSLTAAINNVDHVPGRSGELCFVGVGEGISTETAVVESIDSALTLIQTTKRGAPAPKSDIDKAKLRNFSIPHVQLEDTINAASFQGVREFGTNDLVSPDVVVNKRLEKLGLRHDLTLEHHRLGALQGKILDADGTTLTDLFAAFNLTNDNSAVGGGSEDVSRKIVNLNLSPSSEGVTDLRTELQGVARYVKRVAKIAIPPGAEFHVFCGDDFFDALISRDDVKKAFETSGEQVERLGGNYSFSQFAYGGFIFENYQGTDDNSTVAIATDEASMFLTGVPGLYAEYFAPADFMETANTNGLPRYAKAALDPMLGRWVKLHTQQNPLPLCLRPQTLIKFTA
jgi:hypothetical protein